MNAVGEQPTSTGNKPMFSPEHLREALAHAALEGLQPTPEGMADLEAVSLGLLDEQAFLARLKARYGG